MLTRKRFPTVVFTGEQGADFRVLQKAVVSYLNSLEDKNALTISQAQIYVDQGLQFPSTQVSSSDANNLDDYKEGSWTPVLTFATPGDLSVSYSAQVGTYTKVGRKVCATFRVITSAFTFTTATGQLEITGLPYAAMNTANAIWEGTLIWGGITKAGYTQVASQIQANTQIITFAASGSGVAASNVVQTDTPSGGAMVLRGTILYETA